MELLIPRIMRDKELEDMIDRYAEVEWKLSFERARQEMEARAHQVNIDIDKEKKDTPFGELVACMDYREWCWLKEQYGEGITQDIEFLRDYKKFRDQGHLASI
jgi:hypothetical protein